MCVCLWPCDVHLCAVYVCCVYVCCSTCVWDYVCLCLFVFAYTLCVYMCVGKAHVGYQEHLSRVYYHDVSSPPPFSLGTSFVVPQMKFLLLWRMSTWRRERSRRRLSLCLVLWRMWILLSWLAWGRRSLTMELTRVQQLKVCVPESVGIGMGTVICKFVFKFWTCTKRRKFLCENCLLVVICCICSKYCYTSKSGHPRNVLLSTHDKGRYGYCYTCTYAHVHYMYIYTLKWCMHARAVSISVDATLGI